MNDYSLVVNAFGLLKRRGWIKVGTNTIDEIFFPNCKKIAVKCVGWNCKYPIWLLSIPHELSSDLCISNYDYNIEVDKYNNYIRLLIYKENMLLKKTNLIKLSDFEKIINNNLSQIAFIYSDNKIEKRQHYYRYNELKMMRLKGFDTFLQLLNKKIINIMINDKSVRFIISKMDLDKLYKIEYNYNDKLQSFLSFLDK